ncbi:OsmC family protein [Taibaiella lutea]|uniref:OsmC family protein n=1 Tax=Taibaiella lutea TaxID=2608001 RepID=A0A5M6CG63_9BACT|nr:OsmC family protein [Taibaiella lutea]KAA5532109.1 OsmC family protein [Taibaiella lutea]
MTSKIIYNGNLRTTATHLQSGTVIETDAPKDNHGLGEKFSPTDLVATALGSCMISIMGIAGRTHNINVDLTECSIEKIMVADPRRIGEIVVHIYMKGQDSFTDKQKSIMEHAALTCPVYLSLHPDIKKTVTFHW